MCVTCCCACPQHAWHQAPSGVLLPRVLLAPPWAGAPCATRAPLAPRLLPRVLLAPPSVLCLCCYRVRPLVPERNVRVLLRRVQERVVEVPVERIVTKEREMQLRAAVTCCTAMCRPSRKEQQQ